jgi:hypothetical protein
MNLRPLLLALALASCRYSLPDLAVDDAAIPDAITYTDDANERVFAACNPVTQIGCAADEKCTWIVDYSTASNSIGHIGCAPDGSVAANAVCTVDSQGNDSCAKGSYCVRAGASGKCRTLCDASTPCSTSGGAANFGYVCDRAGDAFVPTPNAQPLAQVCYPKCDPLADNDFKATGAKSGVGYTASTGNVCDANEGCYGWVGTAGVDTFACRPQCDGSAADCPSKIHQTYAGAQPAINACAQGYIPLFFERTIPGIESYKTLCTAFCKPVDCYAGNCGTGTYGNLIGVAPHQCHDNDIRLDSQVSGPATLSGNNNDHCRYAWVNQVDGSGLHRTAASDQLGVCMNHSAHWYDTNFDGVRDAPIPNCSTCININGTGVPDGAGKCTCANGCVGAADFGCVSSATAGK